MENQIQKNDLQDLWVEYFQADSAVRLHGKKTIEEAIRAGRCLEEIKVFCPGTFTKELQKKGIIHRTAINYMNCAQHADKIENFSNLSEAYQEIKKLEDQRKIKDHNRKDNLIKERVRTGKKPKGWNRSVEYEYQKQQREERIEEVFEQPKIEQKESQKTKAEEILEDLIKDSGDGSAFKNYNLNGLIEELRHRILAIQETSERHAVINRIIRYMRELAIECDRLAVQKNHV